MEYKRIEIGDECAFPLDVLGEGSGWGRIISDESGVLVVSDNTPMGGIFLTDAQLKSLGYYYRKPSNKKKQTKK